MFQLRYIFCSLWASVSLVVCQEYITPISFGVMLSFLMFVVLKAHDSFFYYKEHKRRNMYISSIKREKELQLSKSNNRLLFEQSSMFMEIIHKLKQICNILCFGEKVKCKKNGSKVNFCQPRKSEVGKSKTNSSKIKKRQNNPGIVRQALGKDSVKARGSNKCTMNKSDQNKCNNNVNKIRMQGDSSSIIYRSSCFGENIKPVTPLGSFNQIAKNMLNSPIYTWSVEDNIRNSTSSLPSNKKFRKMCLEESCKTIMLSDKPIISNQCSKCLNLKGLGLQSMDFFQYIVTQEYPKLEYFCSCFLGRTGVVKQFTERRCKMCTTPKISLKPN